MSYYNYRVSLLIAFFHTYALPTHPLYRTSNTHPAFLPIQRISVRRLFALLSYCLTLVHVNVELSVINYYKENSLLAV